MVTVPAVMVRFTVAVSHRALVSQISYMELSEPLKPDFWLMCRLPLALRKKLDT